MRKNERGRMAPTMYDFWPTLNASMGSVLPAVEEKVYVVLWLDINRTVRTIVDVIADHIRNQR